MKEIIQIPKYEVPSLDYHHLPPHPDHENPNPDYDCLRPTPATRIRVLRTIRKWKFELWLSPPGCSWHAWSGGVWSWGVWLVSWLVGRMDSINQRWISRQVLKLQWFRFLPVAVNMHDTSYCFADIAEMKMLTNAHAQQQPIKLRYGSHAFAKRCNLHLVRCHALRSAIDQLWVNWHQHATLNNVRQDIYPKSLKSRHSLEHNGILLRW